MQGKSFRGGKDVDRVIEVLEGRRENASDFLETVILIFPGWVGSWWVVGG